MRWSSLVLCLIALVAAAFFPLTLGYDATAFLVDVGAAIGFAAAWLLAKRGHLRGGSNTEILVATVVIAILVAAEPETSRHHLILHGLIVPILLAFLLDRVWLGGGLIGATLVFLVLHAGAYTHVPGEVQSIAFVILAASSIGAVDAGLRGRERRRAEASETEAGRLRGLNEMRMQFINTAAHDLRTPLTPLKLAMASGRPGIPSGRTTQHDAAQRRAL